MQRLYILVLLLLAFGLIIKMPIEYFCSSCSGDKDLELSSVLESKDATRPFLAAFPGPYYGTYMTQLDYPNYVDGQYYDYLSPWRRQHFEIVR